MDREDFIVTEGVDGLLGQEPRVMYRAVIDHLPECVIFIGDGCIVDVDQAICAAGQQDVVTSRVILELYGKNTQKGNARNVLA